MAQRRAWSKESDKDQRRFWTSHEWLASSVERHVALLTHTPTTPIGERDPMLFFIRMLAHSAIVCLGSTVIGMPLQSAEHQHRTMGIVLTYEQRASRAALEMVRLVKLPSLSRFKAHPFLPNLLASALTYLNTRSVGKDGQLGAELLLSLLRDLRGVNSLALEICSTFSGS